MTSHVYVPDTSKQHIARRDGRAYIPCKICGEAPGGEHRELESLSDDAGSTPEIIPVDVYREGDYWMISVPSLDGLTQARSEAEIPISAREFIAVTLDRPIETIAVEIRPAAQEGDR